MFFGLATVTGLVADVSSVLRFNQLGWMRILRAHHRTKQQEKDREWPESLAYSHTNLPGDAYTWQTNFGAFYSR